MKDFIKRFKEVNYDMHPAAKILYGGLLLLILIGVATKLFNKPDIFLMIIALYTGIVFHEVAHGYAALAMGDPTAKMWRRLTLNPLNHIDIAGLIVPILLIFMGSPVVLGWAKPVPVNFRLIKKKKIGMFFVAVAGITVNIINVILAAALLKLFAKSDVVSAFNIIMTGSSLDLLRWENIVIGTLVYIILINLGLAIFNLIPIPPLDGSRILEAFGNEKVRVFVEAMEKYGFIVLIVLLYFKILDVIINPAYEFGLHIVAKILQL